MIFGEEMAYWASFRFRFRRLQMAGSQRFKYDIFAQVPIIEYHLFN